MPMQKTTTQPIFLNKIYREMEPKGETLRTILAFANTYNVEKLENGEEIYYFSN